METLENILTKADLNDEFADLLGNIWILEDKSYCGLVLVKKSDPSCWIHQKLWKYVLMPLKRHYTHDFKWKIEEPRNEDLIKESIKKLAEQFGLEIKDPEEPQGPCLPPYKHVWEGYIEYEIKEKPCSELLDVVTDLYITDLQEKNFENDDDTIVRKFRITTESID